MISNTLPWSSLSPPLLFVARRCSPRLSFSTRRRSRTYRRRRPNPILPKKTFDLQSSPDSQNIKLVLDLDQISSLPSSKLHYLLSFSRDAIHDLKNLITIDTQTRTIHVSCRKSTLQFAGTLFLCGTVLVFTIRVFFCLLSTLKTRFRPKEKLIVRRDRSLGGREVVVGKSSDYRQHRAVNNPLSSGRAQGSPFDRKKAENLFQVEKKLPKWWPESVVNGGSLLLNREEYQREANRLVRAISDNRTSGMDILADDSIQLRQICRTAGVCVSFDTVNTRDSFYRSSIDMVLSVCCRVPSYSTSVEIDGEDAQQFIAGLSENVGLDKFRAARMISAAVAARTRLQFLQAWALEMQGKHSEALGELSKICIIFRIFPPEESSPELEMVARGLEKLLKVEQREFLMAMLVGVCGNESRRSAAEALGLVY